MGGKLWSTVADDGRDTMSRNNFLNPTTMLIDVVDLSFIVSEYNQHQLGSWLRLCMKNKSVPIFCQG